MSGRSLAYRDGFARGANAAGWWIQENGGGRDTRSNASVAEWANDMLDKWEAGDPAVSDMLACPVNLSGEWADGPTPETVADLYARRPSPEALDDLCTEWEEGAGDGFLREVLRHLRACAKVRP